LKTWQVPKAISLRLRTSSQYTGARDPVKSAVLNGLLLTFAQDEQAAADRLLARKPGLRIGDAAVVHIHAARLHETPGFALRGRELHPRNQVDHPSPSPPNASAGSSVDGTSSNTASTSSALSVFDVLAEQDGGGVLRARDMLGAMDERRHFARERALCVALFRRDCRLLRELADLHLVENVKYFQILDDVRCLGVEPELIEPNGEVRSGSSHTVPASVFPELRTRRGLEQRPHEAVGFPGANPADQIDAAVNVAPLIAAAHLQRAVVPIEQLEESRACRRR